MADGENGGERVDCAGDLVRRRQPVAGIFWRAQRGDDTPVMVKVEMRPALFAAPAARAVMDAGTQRVGGNGPAALGAQREIGD